jgi:hypothetical protein
MAARKPKIAWGDDAFELVMKIINNAASSGKIGKSEQAIKTGRRITKQMQQQGKTTVANKLNKRINNIEQFERDYKKITQKAAPKKTAPKKVTPKKKK